MFYQLYRHYRDTWDMEMKLFRNGMTYEALFRKSQAAEEWLP